MDLFNFPFHADVWGTASEWVMIVVTVLTAIFLYRTLKSQKEVQQTQNRLLEIELVRLRKQFEVKLQYNPCQTDEIPKEDQKDFISIGVSNVSNNTALNFHVIPPKDKKIKLVIIKPYPANLINSKEHPFLHFLVKPAYRDSIFGFEFFVRYEDEIGTKYSQEVYYHLSESEERKIEDFTPLMIVN